VARVPASLDEFFDRLDRRRVEADLRAEFRDRLGRESRGVSRLGKPEVVEAVCRRLVPSEAVAARALAVFLDDVFDKQKGRGDEKVGVMSRERLIPTGFDVLEETARRERGSSFVTLDSEAQDDLLSRSERGDIRGPDGFDPASWFTRVRELVLLGYGSDPRGMVEMGFPGPSYRTGHIWLSENAVRARAERKPGYLEL
jgi:hypothetical protein